MNPEVIQAWIDIATIMISKGIATFDVVSAMIKMRHPGATDAELNVVLVGVQKDAAAREALARADAGKPPTTKS